MFILTHSQFTCLYRNFIYDKRGTEEIDIELLCNLYDWYLEGKNFEFLYEYL